MRLQDFQALQLESWKKIATVLKTSTEGSFTTSPCVVALHLTLYETSLHARLDGDSLENSYRRTAWSVRAVIVVGWLEPEAEVKRRRWSCDSFYRKESSCELKLKLDLASEDLRFITCCSPDEAASMSFIEYE